MTLSDRRSQLMGAVRDAAGRPAGGARVVIFPRDRERWADAGFDAPERVLIARGDRTGRYAVETANTGDFLVAAVTSPPEFWMAPEHLETLVPFATFVRLELGQQRSIDLRLP